MTTVTPAEKRCRQNGHRISKPNATGWRHCKSCQERIYFPTYGKPFVLQISRR